MNLLFDTNVLLDVLFDREPHLRDSAWAYGLVERGKAVGLMGSTTCTTIYYLGQRRVGEERTRGEIRRLLRLFEVAAVGRPVLEEALDGVFDDFEDAVLYEAGRRAGAEAIVTRNTEDFTEADVPVYTPTELRLALDE